MMNMNNLAQTHEILTPQLATKVGLTKFEFYKYVKANEYEQVGHGVYAAKDTWIDELEMLHRRCPMGVFSHDEAFYYYGLTDREPLVHTLTIYSGYNVHRLKEDGYKVYTVKKELVDVGKQIVKSNQGNEIPMYDTRLRNKIFRKYKASGCAGVEAIFERDRRNQKFIGGMYDRICGMFCRKTR